VCLWSFKDTLREDLAIIYQKMQTVCAGLIFFEVPQIRRNMRLFMIRETSSSLSVLIPDSSCQTDFYIMLSIINKLLKNAAFKSPGRNYLVLT